MLSGKYQGGSAPEGARFTLFPGYMERYTKSPTKAAVARYMEVAEKYGLTSTQLALAWCQQQWHVTSSIIGATSMNQLKEDIAAFAVGELPGEWDGWHCELWGAVRCVR